MDDDRRREHKGAVKHGTHDDSVNRRSSMFELRLVTLDHYLAAPSAPLDPLVSKLGGWEVWQVPVLRIFGVTPAGQKACLHVHGVLPYLTVPCTEPRPERSAVVLASEIDLLLNTAAGRATSMHRHVHHVAVFRGTRLYGFHDREETFLRIYLYNPLHVPKVAELLLSGHVLKQVMQPHEAHIPYSLQFMVDHNLHGMSFVRVESFKFRRPLSWAHDDRSKALGSGPGIWSLRNLPVEQFGDLEKQTTCELELDCCAKDILNASDKEALNPGLAALWQEEEDRRQEPVSWAPLSLEDVGFPPTESERFYLARLDKLLTRPAMDEQELTGTGKQSRKKHHSRLLDTSHGILDSQDEALAEALAQVASSWHQGADEEDSILGSLPALDNVVDEEDDNDVEDMSQVFQLAGEREQDNDGDSSMSDHSDGNEAYDPFQLDGADDRPVGASGTAATTRDQGTQTGARPPVLVRRLLGRARARRCTRLSLQRQQQQQQQQQGNPQLRKPEQSPAKSAVPAAGLETGHQKVEVPGSSPLVAEDWQRWQSCHVASMLMAPLPGDGTPSSGVPSPAPSLSAECGETSSCLQHSVKPCFVELPRLTDEEIASWQQRREPEGRRRWKLRELDVHGKSCASPVEDMSEPKKQRRKRGRSTDSSVAGSTSPQRRASSLRNRSVSVSSVSSHVEGYTESEVYPVEVEHRTRRVSYSSSAGDSTASSRRVKAGTGKRVKAANDSASGRTLRERDIGEKGDKGQVRVCITDSGDNVESSVLSAAAAAAGLGSELSVPLVQRVPHPRRGRKLSTKRRLAVEVAETVPDSDASSSLLSSSSHLVGKSSDLEVSGSRPSIICRIRIQGKHGVVSTTSTRQVPRVVGFVSPDRSISESCVADLGSPPTGSVSDSSSSTIVGRQMSDGPMSGCRPLGSEMADPGIASRHKVSKKSKSSNVALDAPAVHLECSKAAHMSDAPTSLTTPLSSEVADSGIVLRRPKSSRRSELSTVTPEAPATQLESSGATHMLDVPEPVATPLSSEVADLGATLRGKFSRNSKSGTNTPQAPSAQLEDSEVVTMPDASTSLATSSSSEVADSGVILRQPRSPRKSKLSTVTREAPAVPSESSEAAHVSDAPTPLAMSLSGKVADSGVVSRRLKSSRKSKSSTAAPDPPAVHLESCEAATVPDAPQSDATPLSSEVADRGVVLRAKFSRKSKSSTVIPEAPAAHLESSEAVHMPDAAEPVASPLRPENSDSGVALRLKRSRKSKLSTVTPEAQLESSEAAHMPDTPTSHATSSEVADSGAVLRRRGSRKSMSNTITPEASETELASPKAMLSETPPTTVGLSSSDVAPHGLPSRKSTRSGSGAGTKRAKLAASSIASKPTESPEALSSSPVKIGNIDNHQLCGSNSRMEMGAPHATLGTLKSGSDVDAIEEPGNVKPVSKRGRPRRTDFVRPLLSSPDSQGAADAASDDSTAHCENTVQPTTRRTRRQLANPKLSSKELSATSSSSLESVTSFSSCEVGGSQLLETSLPKEGNLRKQTGKGKQTSSSKLAIKPSRSKVRDSNALLSLGTDSVNATELGTDPVVQVVDQAAKSNKSEARGRVSSRISANKLALRTKIHKEGKNKEKPESPKLQNESCFVADTSGTPPPGSDIGLASTVTVDTMTSCVLSFGTAYSTSPSTAKLVSDCNMTRQVSSGSQVTSSGMGDKGISTPNSGAPEIVNSHSRLMSSTSRSSASSDRREMGGLPVRSSKSRKRAGLPEAHDPGIQELLVTYERLTITPPSELSSDGSVGSKQSNVARPSAAFNLSEAARSSNSPRRSSSSSITNSVEKEGTQKFVSNNEPEAEHPNELSGSSNPIVEKESGSAKSVVSSDRSEAADAGGLMRGADKGAENSPELVPALLVPNCAVTKPGTEDSMIQPSSVSIANADLVATKELETSSLCTGQCQSEVAAFDIPVSSNLPVSEVIISEPATEPVVPEEANSGSAFSSNLASADTSANVDLHAGSDGPVPGGSVQGNWPIISASTVDVSEPVAKPKVSDEVGTDAPPNEVLLNALPLGSGSDGSSLSSNSSASVLSRPRMTSPIEQSSSQLLDSRHAVQDGSVTELMTELSWSIELGQRVTEGCAEQDANVTGTPELVPSLCGQKGNESQKASSDDAQFEGEPSSCICAGSKRTTAEQPSAVGSINAAEMSSVDDDFICLSPDADAEWILLDEVRDDSIELFPSSEESVAVDCSESCIDHTVENRVSDCGLNCHNMDVSEKNGIGDMCKKELVGHFDGVNTEENVHEDVADENSIQHGSRKSRSERKVDSVSRESSIDKSCESSIRNVGSINCADSATGDNCVVEIGSEGCSEATSNKEHFEISSTDLADTNCEEILRNFGSNSSLVDLGSESFSEPTGDNKCTEEVAKEDVTDISSADLVKGFGSENCVGDIDSEGIEFIASENFVEDIGCEESMELFSGIDSECKQHKDAVALNEISSDPRQHEDIYAAIAAGKLLRVAVERLEDIDAHSAIGMLYRKAKKASKCNRAPCKGVEISGGKHDVNRDNSQDEHTGINEKEGSVGLSSVRKSPACHRQTSRPSKSLHKDVGASSSQSSGRRPSDSQAQHQSPREQDRSVRPVSVEKALASDQQTSKFSKTSRKDLWASGNQHSRDQTDESHAQHVKTRKQEGNNVPFSEEKLSSSVKITSKSSKTLHKDSRDTCNQHVEKSTKDSKTQHLGVRKKDRSANPLTADKSSICHQKASRSSKASNKGVQAFKSKDSEGSSKKAETQRPVREKQGEAVEPSSLEMSPGREQQASNPSKGSRRDVQVLKSEDSEGSSNKAETRHADKEKQGEAVDPSSLEMSTGCDQQASKSSKASRRDVQVFKSKDSEGSSNKAQTRHADKEKQGEAVDPSSLEMSTGCDQQASKSSKASRRDVQVFKSKDSEGSSNKAETRHADKEKQGEAVDPSSLEMSTGCDQQASKSSKASRRDVQVFKSKDSEGSSNKAQTRHADKEKQGEAVDPSSLEMSTGCDQQASKSSKASRRDVQVFKSKDSDGSSNKTETRHADEENQREAVDHSSLERSPGCDQQASKSSKASRRDVQVFKSKDSEGRSNKAETRHADKEKQGEAFDPSSLEMSTGCDQQASKSSKASRKDVQVFKSKDSEGSSNKAETRHADKEKQGEAVDPSSLEQSPGCDQQASKSSKASRKDVQVFKSKDSEGSSNKAETRHADKEKQGEAVDPSSLERSPGCDQQASKSPKASRRDVQVFKSKDSEGSSNKAETQRADREKQGEAVEPSSLQKSPGPDQQTSKSSRDFHSDLGALENPVQVCENRERRPDSPEEQQAGSGTQQQDECTEPLQTEKSLSYHQREPLPPTDMGKEHVLLDQVLDLGELPDAIKCLLDSEVPLPELDADCFSLPPDSTRWLSEDGVVEKRKPDERAQANKEEPPFCPSGDIMLGELTKACSLTNEGLVALVPAVPPPTCGPHFNSCGSTTVRARKKCLRGLAHWQKTKLEAFARDSCFEVDFEHNPELRIAFCRDRSVVLTPARSAPTVALLAPTRQRPPPSPDDDVVSIRELPPSDASPDPTMLLVSPPSTPPRHETSTSQLDGPSGRFALSGARLPADTERVLTVLSVEVHVRTRSDLRPDPAHDPVQCVLWCARGHGTDAPLEAGVMHWVLGDPRLADIEDLAGTSLHRTGVATPGLRTQVVRSELDLFHALVDLVHRWDPDVLLGYDVERASWGYLFERAEQLDLDLYARLSRAPPPPGRKDVLGRILLSVWRILRKEVTLNIYTFENTYYNVMHRRVPLYSFRLLSEWFSKDLFRWRTVEHYALRARGNLELLDELNVFGKTSQMARIFGIQFLEVLSRGSQFRVESMLLRLARSHRMVALSASTAQRARQRAPEFIPLVLEPRAQLYTDPVVVLDFQSLYPSVIIAHNYCYSTCLGRVESLGSSAPFGCSSLEVPMQLVKSLRDHITVSPAGVAFVKPSIRRGLLSQMLDEVLGTRIMVKKAMSQCTNKGLRRVLDAQQLSLKLIANVTYGYTSAGFSGRMPCVEVADSVVSKGREALEHAIRTAEAIVPGARVVYGDTDSLFVLLEGRSREEAFRLGQEIADQVTAQNPRPMRLKLEKVYQPCVLQTKKRYVGFAYESPDQQEPKYDAKGIETVRRDTCPAVAKLLEKMLRVLFTSRDIVAVKRFVKLQLSKILAERVSPQDFIFAREFRGLHGYQPSACVPALEITRRQLRRDPRAEPLVGERVPYVVVYGHPGQRLIELARSPLELLSGQLRLNAHYYVARVIGPALNRVLRLLGADCLQWYEELPRPRFVAAPRPGTMAAYVTVNQLCLACGGQAESRQLCASCEADPGYAALVLGGKVQRVQKALLELQAVCHSCMGFQAGSVCLSIDCPVLFKTSRVTTEAQQALDWNSARNSVSTTSS
ncbi:serine-rich adhesin for platelets isoform X2 [Dermacentor albipictus]|uniref:serine-rich adhesin for platelets isoform X2 n=1 Tax=Dermacentor albipictus TaxID=60249 RepID=UPI0031FCDCCD